MQSGAKVVDNQTKLVGIIEKQNLSSYYINFEGGKRLWRKANEITLVPADYVARPAAAAPSASPTKPSGGARPALTGSPAKPVASPARPSLGGGGAAPTLKTFPSVQLPSKQAPVSAAPPPKKDPEPQPTSPKQPDQQAPKAVASTSPSPATSSPNTTKPTNASPAPAPTPAPAPAPTPVAPPPQAVAPAPVEAPASLTPAFSDPGLDTNQTWNIEFDELEFDHVVGSGKFGEVYFGYYLGTPVAIKKILESDEDTKKSIERELGMLKNARHPNIVQFLGICMHKTDIFFVTEFMEKGDLFDALFFGETELSWKTKVHIALDTAMACYYLQMKNILHRDLKSQNILLTESHRAKLCDLGLARALNSAATNRHLTFVGTDRWMAPEICLGMDYDFKVDVFSYGVVLVEIITGAVPDERRPQEKFALNEGAFRAKVPSDCPPALAQICVDCTRLDPRMRPNFRAVLERMRKIYEDLEENGAD